MPTLQQHVNLKPYNTFGIQASASYFTTLQSLKEAEALLQSDVFKNNKHLFLGGGSNILLTGDFNGLVVKIDLKGITTLREDDDFITLKVGAGENWHDLVMYCVDRNYGGIENLSLIPGTVGAAPMQNIGAYGVELKKNIDEVEALELATGNVKTFTKEACVFGYRESIFKAHYKDQFLISSITLTLTKKNHQFVVNYGAIEQTLQQNGVSILSVKAISDAVVRIRRSKLPDPAVIGNAGSFFKNPSIQAELYAFIKNEHPSLPSFPSENGLIKIPAAWLIEHCGWKGKTINTIGVHKDQALVLVNYGGGTGRDIWQLAMDIQASVKEKFNVTLQPEVNKIG